MPAPLREIAVKPFFDLFLFGKTCWVADTENDTIVGFDIDTGKATTTIKGGPGLRASATYIVGSKRDIDVWDVKGKAIGKLVFDPKDTFSTSVDELDRDGKYAVGTDGENFVVWNPKTSKITHTEHLGYWSTARISPDGSTIAILARKKNVVLVDPEQRFAKREVPGTKDGGGDVAWSPDQPIFTMTSGLTTLVVDHAKAKITKLRTPRSQQGIFIPKRDRFVMGEKKLTIFDTKTWKPVGIVEVAAHMLAASEDGKRIVTCGRDGPIRVWDTDDFLGDVKAEKPKKPKKSKGQPIRGVFFGVPKSVNRDALIAAANNLHYILDRQPPDFAMELHLSDGTRDRHWFRFLGTRGRNYALEPWIECLYSDLEEPIDVVLRTHEGVKARRFDPSPGTDITVPDDYLDAARVDEPILVIRKGVRHGKHVRRADIKDLINTVELYYSPSFIGAAETKVPKAY